MREKAPELSALEVTKEKALTIVKYVLQSVQNEVGDADPTMLRLKPIIEHGIHQIQIFNEVGVIDIPFALDHCPGGQTSGNPIRNDAGNGYRVLSALNQLGFKTEARNSTAFVLTISIEKFNELTSETEKIAPEVREIQDGVQL